MRHLLFLLLLCLFVPVHASQEEIPFMYYYDEAEEAFIVERANGSDRHILAEYSFPEVVNSDYMEIGGAGWSPSGAWFVWTELLPGGVSSSPVFNVWIVSRNSREKSRLLPEGDYVLGMEWHPSQDILMVRRWGGDDVYRHQVTIINVHNRKILFQIDDTELDFTLGQYLLSELLPDGEHIALYFPSDEENYQAWTMQVYALDGTLISERQVWKSSRYHEPTWSDIMRVSYISANGNSLIVEDFLTETILAIFNIPNPELHYLDWHNSGDYAFAYFGSPSSGSYSLYLISLLDNSITELSADSHPQWRASNANGFSDYQSTWSSDNTWGFYVDGSDIVIVDLPSLTSRRLSNPDSSSRFYSFGYEWLVDEETFVISIGSTTYVYEDVALVPIFDEGFGEFSGFFALSNTRRYIAFSNCMDSGSCIVDLQTNEVTNLTVELEYRDASANGFLWNPQTDEWLIFYEWMTVGYHDLAVGNVDGSTQRTLDVTCFASPSCYGWMPEVE